MIDVLISTRNDNTEQILETLQNLDGLEENINFKILLVNDSSKKLNLDQLSTNIKSRINLIKTPMRKGLAFALNYGASYGNSKYIARLDQGDLSDNQRFVDQQNELKRNEKLAFVGLQSKLNYLRDDGSIAYSEESSGPISTKKMRSLLKIKNPLVHGSVMLKRACFEDVGGYKEDFILAQDYELYLRLLKNSYEGMIIKGPLHSHNYSKASNTIKKNKKSRFFGLKARLINYQIKDYFNLIFLVMMLKDLCLLLVPSKLIQLIKRLKYA